MALANFSVPYGGLAGQGWTATINPLQSHHASAVNGLLYGPAGHQQADDYKDTVPRNYYNNNPYSFPSSNQNQNNNFRLKTRSNEYLPPQTLSQSQQIQNKPRLNSQQQIHPPSNSYLPVQPARTYGEASYSNIYNGNNNPFVPGSNFYNGYRGASQLQGDQSLTPQISPIPPTDLDSRGSPPSPQYPQPEKKLSDNQSNDDEIIDKLADNNDYPQRLPGFIQVKAGQGSRTQVHAVLDYDADEDDEEYYESDPNDHTSGLDGKHLPTVTPIQGPIFIQNGSVPVVPLFSYPTLNNGSFLQIPIWWTALSVALGLNIRGDVIKGVPCVKRYHQLFCPTAGNSYPIDKIEKFIDDNKALMRRMYGDFEMLSANGPGGKKAPPQPSTRKKKRSSDTKDLAHLPGVSDVIVGPDGNVEFIPDIQNGDSYFANWRRKRQSTSFRGNEGGTTSANNNSRQNQGKQDNRKPTNKGPSAGKEGNTGRVDSCESKIEIVTPYWASNSAGKIRAIVNTQHFEQAIHQEICSKTQTGRCSNDCGCEQKYKWHRLLAYDPDNDCKGIFMDWFLFPSCCVCRCQP